MEARFMRGEEKLLTVVLPPEAVQPIVLIENFGHIPEELRLKALIMKISGDIAHSMVGLQVGDHLFVDDEFSDIVSEDDIKEWESQSVGEPEQITEECLLGDLFDILSTHTESNATNFLKSLPLDIRELIRKNMIPSYTTNADGTPTLDVSKTKVDEYNAWWEDILSAPELADRPPTPEEVQ